MLAASDSRIHSQIDYALPMTRIRLRAGLRQRPAVRETGAPPAARQRPAGRRAGRHAAARGAAAGDKDGVRSSWSGVAGSSVAKEPRNAAFRRTQMATTTTTRKAAIRTATAALLAMLMAATPAFAITAGEVLDKMTEKERFGYITGAVDMIMLTTATSEKNTAKAECILAWHYGEKAPGPRLIVETFGRYRDRNAVGLIKLLIDRACPAK